MKGNPELIDTLNDLLASELAAINQYMVHAEMAGWGYERLSKNFKTRSITEMTHAERLIERILFLEGTPIVSNLDDIHVGATIPQRVDNDHASELTAIKMYNGAIVRAGSVLDRIRATSSRPSCATRTSTSTSWRSCRTRSSG